MCVEVPSSACRNPPWPTALPAPSGSSPAQFRTIAPPPRSCPCPRSRPGPDRRARCSGGWRARSTDAVPWCNSHVPGRRDGSCPRSRRLRTACGSTVHPVCRTCHRLPRMHPGKDSGRRCAKADRRASECPRFRHGESRPRPSSAGADPSTHRHDACARRGCEAAPPRPWASARLPPSARPCRRDPHTRHRRDSRATPPARPSICRGNESVAPRRSGKSVLGTRPARRAELPVPPHRACRTARLALRDSGRAGRSGHLACYVPFVRSLLPVPASPFTGWALSASPASVST